VAEASQTRPVCEEVTMERSDEELLAALVAGDADGFSEFYRRHLPAVTGYFARRVADREAAFDLTAETFAAVVLSARRFDPGRGPAVAWLLGIAAHKLTDSVRRQRVEELSRNGPDLCELVAGLSPEHRDAVTARVIDERSYSDIAADVRCSEAVVRQRVHRGLERLRDQLEETT